MSGGGPQSEKSNDEKKKNHNITDDDVGCSTCFFSPSLESGFLCIYIFVMNVYNYDGSK